MNFQVRSHRTTAGRQLPFECVALLLQGGGALGAYQGGVYEALAEADIHPDWIAGISIGAINAAIIAGNAPNEPGRSLARVLDAGDFERALALAGNPFMDLARSDHTRNLAQPDERQSALACRRKRLLLRATCYALAATGRHARGDQLL